MLTVNVPADPHALAVGMLAQKPRAKATVGTRRISVRWLVFPSCNKNLVADLTGEIMRPHLILSDFNFLFSSTLIMPILGLAPSSKPTYPPHFDIENVIRPNILSLHPYRCARDDYKQGILLDANENAFGHSITRPNEGEGVVADLQTTLDLDLHRYPDPSHVDIKQRIASLRGVPGPEYVFLGVGSDEVIDLLMRVCVVPGGREKILTTPPTYGMYAVCAQVNDVGVVKVALELQRGEDGEGGERGRFSVCVDKVSQGLLNLLTF